MAAVLFLLALATFTALALASGNVAPIIHAPKVVTVREDTAIGTILGQLVAEDADGPEKVTLKIADNATADLVTLGVPIRRQVKTISDIILNSQLDSDFASPTKTLVFTAFDGGVRKTATVTLQVTDVNDNAPQFALPKYSANIRWNSPIGSIVVITTAVDPDSTFGGIVQYSLRTDDLFTFQAFKVNLYTGMVTVNAPLILEKGKNMHFYVVATDGGGLSSTANVTVSVL